MSDAPRRGDETSERIATNGETNRADDDRRHLLHATRLAVRGHGRAEPNPMVGCVIVDDDDAVVGFGWHEQCGGPHAEVHALRRAGVRARGATMYVTLEPCNHTGRTAPCSEALIAAGVARVVLARRDPSAEAGGGIERLLAAGIDVRVTDACPEAAAITDPFAYRQRTGLPWVVLKWAQTIDGRIATRTGESQWISGADSRRLVHRERGRVDAILTGIGTVIADDPRLTARDVRLRRRARRVVIDPELRTPADAHLVTSARDVPTTILCRAEALDAHADRAALLRTAGVELLGIPAEGRELPLAPALTLLVERHDVTNVLVEAGAGLTGRLLRDKLANQVWIFVAPILFADDAAIPSARGLAPISPADGIALTLISQRRRGRDVVLRYGMAERHRGTEARRH